MTKIKVKQINKEPEKVVVNIPVEDTPKPEVKKDSWDYR